MWLLQLRHFSLLISVLKLWRLKARSSGLWLPVVLRTLYCIMIMSRIFSNSIVSWSIIVQVTCDWPRGIVFIGTYQETSFFRVFKSVFTMFNKPAHTTSGWTVIAALSAEGRRLYCSTTEGIRLCLKAQWFRLLLTTSVYCFKYLGLNL